MTGKTMHLGYLMYDTGGHPMSWQHADTHAANDIGFFCRLAQIAEAAKFDMLFRADIPAARTTHLDAWSRFPLYMNVLEPLTLLSALAGATTHIGLAGTISTSFSEPYNVARQLASLDHISGGRAAWNVVTTASGDAARNFGFEAMPERDQRYARAREFVDAVRALWDTYEDDAIIGDREQGQYFNPAKFHQVAFEGQHVRLRGALNIARPPQGRPVIIQAGQSEGGRALAAATADVVFAGGESLPKAQAFYGDMHRRALAFGRDPSELRILCGFCAVLGDTEADARARFAQLDATVPLQVRLQHLANDLGAELRDLPLDQPIPAERLPQTTQHYSGFFAAILEMAQAGLTLREIALRYRRGSDIVFGNARQIADRMAEWVAEGACDGFNMVFQLAPADLEAFCGQVVPELQRRGLFRKDYTGRTLRDHFGLKHPRNSNL